MKKTYTIVALVAAVAIGAYAGWRIYQSGRARAVGIISEKIVRDGDSWTADFTARIPAAEQQVFDAIKNVESSHSDQVKSVTVVDESEGSKTVDITLDGPGGQPIVARLQFQYVPAERRIAYHTLDNPVLDSNGEYRFEDEGTSTLIVYHQTTQMLQQLPVPDGVVKQVIRSIFIAQLEGLRSTLHIPNGRQSSGEDETSSLLF